jgi:hypothetical protein
MCARRSTSETGKENFSLFFARVSFLHNCASVRAFNAAFRFRFLREDNRQQEIRDLIAKGKIPHSVEVDKHPNKSLEGHMCEFL